MSIKINDNWMVKVKLTNHGKQILDNYKKEFIEFGFVDKLIYDKNGIIEIKLWELMNIFGKYMYIGAENIYENHLIEIRE